MKSKLNYRKQILKYREKKVLNFDFKFYILKIILFFL